MTEPLKQFFKVVHAKDVDDALMDTPIVQSTLNSLEKVGVDLGEAVENMVKNPPEKPQGVVPTYAESAFVKPKCETTLYNVTNKSAEVPEVKKNSNIFKDLSYNVKGLGISADYKKGSNSVEFFAGEEVGIGVKQRKGGFKEELSAKYNVGNDKTSLNYSYKNPMGSCSISVFNQNGNNGLTAKYGNKNGFNSAFSIDKNSTSISCGYRKSYSDCQAEMIAFVSTDNNYKNPLLGVAGRIAF